MNDEYTQSHSPFKGNTVIQNYYSTNISKRKQLNPFANQTNSFQMQFDFPRSTAYYPLTKNYLLTNKNFNNKSNIFPTSHIGLSILNRTLLPRRKNQYLNLKKSHKKISKQEVESIIEKLLETKEPNNTQVVDTEADGNTDLNEDDIRKAEQKRLKLINDIHPKEYIQEAFATEPENPDEFRSYKLQLNSLGNEYNRRHVLNGVNGYNINTVKYTSLHNPTRISSTNDTINYNNEIKAELKVGKEKEKGLFFGNENLRTKKKVKLNYVERVVLPEITFIESMEEKVNETVKMAMDTSDSLKKRSELFRKKQKEYLFSFQKLI